MFKFTGIAVYATWFCLYDTPSHCLATYLSVNFVEKLMVLRCLLFPIKLKSIPLLPERPGLVACLDVDCLPVPCWVSTDSPVFLYIFLKSYPPKACTYIATQGFPLSVHLQRVQSPVFYCSKTGFSSDALPWGQMQSFNKQVLIHCTFVF